MSHHNLWHFMTDFSIQRFFGQLGWFQGVNILNSAAILSTKGFKCVSSEILRTVWAFLGTRGLTTCKLTLIMNASKPAYGSALFVAFFFEFRLYHCTVLHTCFRCVAGITLHQKGLCTSTFDLIDHFEHVWTIVPSYACWSMLAECLALNHIKHEKIGFILDLGPWLVGWRMLAHRPAPRASTCCCRDWETATWTFKCRQAF